MNPQCPNALTADEVHVVDEGLRLEVVEHEGPALVAGWQQALHEATEVLATLSFETRLNLSQPLIHLSSHHQETDAALLILGPSSPCWTHPDLRVMAISMCAAPHL